MKKGRLSNSAMGRSVSDREVLSVPSYILYGEEWTRSIFGFFHIEAFSVRSAPNNWRIALHRHPDVDQLSILFRGRCTYEHDGQEATVKVPSCVYTPANVVHQFAYEPGATGFVISVSSDFAAGLSSVEGPANTAMLRLASCRLAIFDSEPVFGTIRTICDLLAEKFGSTDQHRREALRYLFGALLLELDASFETSVGKSSPSFGGADLFRRYRDAVHAASGQIGFAADAQLRVNTVEGFAALLSTTPYALNAACKCVVGYGARELIQEAMLEQATRLLLYTTRPVKDISFLVGYSNASHFARFFKQRRGITPEAFRGKFAGPVANPRKNSKS